MNKQKLVSAAVGLIIATVVLVGGFLILQGRVGRASGGAPSDFNCLGDRSEITITYKNSADSPGTIVYGTTPDSLTLISDEDGAVGNVSPGTYLHTYNITLLPSSTTYHVEVIGADGTKYPDPATGAPFVCSTTESAQEAGPPELAASAVPTAEPTVASVSSGQSKVEEYYDTHPEATFVDCAGSSDLDGVSGLASLCIKEYNKRK